jgi:hypothetical protein
MGGPGGASTPPAPAEPDWRSDVADSKRNPVEAVSEWAFLFLGIGIAAFLSLLSLLGVDGNQVRMGVIVAHISAMVIGLFMGPALWYFNSKWKSHVEKDATLLSNDMPVETR